MYTNQINNNISFEKRIKLSQKHHFDFPKKSELLNATSPIDFFFEDNSVEKVLSDFKTQLNLKRASTKNPIINSLIHYVYQVNNFFRTLSSAGYLLINSRNFNKTLKTFGSLKPESVKYIDEWAKIGNSCHNKTININLEDRILENIVHQRKNYIFMMNHSDIIKDKYIYALLNSFLNYGYSANNLQKECPRPQIIVSKNVFQIAGNSLKKLYKNLGLVPVNTKVTKYAAQDNLITIKKLTDDFHNKNINLFTFPEGTNSILKNKILKDRIQLRSIKLIEKFLNKSKEIQIIPVGISYDKKPNSLGNINLGSPIILKNENNTINCIINEKIHEIGKSGLTKTHNRLQTVLADILQENIEKSKNLPE